MARLGGEITILYYTILYYTILYYTITYYTILYYTIYYILYHTILHAHYKQLHVHLQTFIEWYHEYESNVSQQFYPSVQQRYVAVILSYM